MSAADCEYWWQKSGRFNMELFNNYLRAKRDAEFQNNIQGQGWQVDQVDQDNPSQQPGGCNQENGYLASVNY